MLMFNAIAGTNHRVSDQVWSAVESLPDMQEEQEVDRRAYALAMSYLVRQEGISMELLERHLSPPLVGRKLALRSAIYEQLLRSAQSAQSMPNVIGGSLGGIEKLSAILFGFDPAAVAKIYPRSEEGCVSLFNDIREQLSPRGKLNYNPRSLWNRFCRTVTSGAAFLASFPDAQAFYRWAETFDAVEDRRVQLAKMIAQQVDGIGFALACDFLKEVGFTNFSKPDVHIKDIFSQLGLSQSKDDVEIFKAVGRVARNVGVTPYEVDQLFWLVGSGDLYLAGLRLRNSKTEFIAFACREGCCVTAANTVSST
ncbi:MAG TPA: hypothetical protein VJ183_13430 [Chloroflexia bacterium]|nr:hypothetical protein [Chloroflexia bacterium]